MTKGFLPTKRQVIAELESVIFDRRFADFNRVGQAKFLHTIRCLEMALQVVKERKFPKGANR